MKLRLPTLPVLPLLLAFLSPSAHAGVVEDLMAKLNGQVCGPVWKGLHLDEVRNRDAVFKDRLLFPWAKIEPHLQAQKMPFEIAQVMIKEDDRASIFQDEEAGKFYEDFFKKAGLEKEHAAIAEKKKILEDALGYAVDSGKLPGKLAKLGYSNATLLEAQKRAAAGLEKFAAILKRDWLGVSAPALREIVALINAVQSPTQLEDAEYLEKELRSHGEKIQDLLKNRGPVSHEPAEKWAKNADGTYKVTLQGYVHFLKRLLRKSSLQKLQARGKIRTVRLKKGAKSLAAYAAIPEALRPFMIPAQSPFKIKHYVFFDELAENANALFIDRLNVIKDNGEIEELAIAMSVLSKEFPDESAARAAFRTRMKASNPDWKPWDEGLEDLLREMEESGFAERLVIQRKDLSSKELEKFEADDYSL